MAAAAAMGGTAQASAAAGAAGRSGSGAVPAKAAGPEPIVAYVGMDGRGEVRLFVGDREIIRHDPGLALRLAQAAAR